MSASTSLPRPSAKTILINLGSVCKERISGCVEKIKEKKAESAKFARNPNQELSNFGSFNQESIDYGAADEFGGSGDKITEWQAGWNVTNAIQVWKTHLY